MRHVGHQLAPGARECALLGDIPQGQDHGARRIRQRHRARRRLVTGRHRHGRVLQGLARLAGLDDERRQHRPQVGAAGATALRQAGHRHRGVVRHHHLVVRVDQQHALAQARHQGARPVALAGDRADEVLHAVGHPVQAHGQRGDLARRGLGCAGRQVTGGELGGGTRHAGDAQAEDARHHDARRRREQQHQDDREQHAALEGPDLGRG